MKRLLSEIAEKITEKKELKNNQLNCYQVFHFIATEFFRFEVKWWWIFSSNILWLDVNKLNQKILVFYTNDNKVAEIVKEVAASHGIKCEKTHRDHFPPEGAY